MSDVYAYFRTTSFPAYFDVIREARERARAFSVRTITPLRTPPGPNYYGAMEREAASASLPVRDWDEQLRARGYRVTPQRQLVLEAVARLNHATPEEICGQVQQTARGVNISTIYRTLELLEQIGLVTHTHFDQRAPVYHLATDADHVHLVCRECGRVSEIGPDAIRPLITALDERHGFETDVSHLTVFGRCSDCRAPR
jgi:Fur family transcriptional regulator, ferric uptake regulator